MYCVCVEGLGGYDNCGCGHVFDRLLNALYIGRPKLSL